MTAIPCPTAIAPASPPRHRLGWIERVRLWRRRAQERRALATMSERDLADIRLTRLEALREATKPFWRD